MSSTPLFDVEALEVVEGLLPIRFAVAEVDVLVQAPEQIGRQHDVAFLGVVVGHFAHVGVDAEDFLAQHDARAPCRWRAPPDSHGTCRRRPRAISIHFAAMSLLRRSSMICVDG